jgi:hypothetical protein
MDARFYIPREMSMRLTLLGFTWASVRDWAMYMNKDIMLKPHRNPLDKEYMLKEGTGWFNMKEFRKSFEEWGRVDAHLRRVFRYASISVITWDQAETWLHETYGVDFIKRPEAGAEKRYLCDVVIPGMGHQPLESQETMRAAQEAALWFVIDNVKELPTIPGPTEEEIEQQRLKDEAEQAQEKEAAIAMLPRGFVLIDDPNFAYRDYISTRYDYKIGSYVGIPKVTVHKAEDVILEEN